MEDPAAQQLQEAPPPARPKRRFGFWVLLFMAVGFFCVSGVLILLVLVLVAGHSGAVAPPGGLSEVTIKGSGTDKILMMRIKGIITSDPVKHYLSSGPSMVDMVKKQLDRAERDKEIKAVVVEVDSPGGGITASDILCKRFVDFKKRSKAKVVAVMGDVAASGGYYVSAPAHRIVAHPTTITGSIGVIMPLMNVTELVKRWGIKTDPIKSGDMKDMGSMTREMRPEERELLQEMIDEMHDRFVTIVATHRAMPKDRAAKLADGRIYTGAKAQELGLVDDIGYVEDAIEIAKKLAGIKQARLIRYRRELGLRDLLGAVASSAAQPRRLELSLAGHDAATGYCPQYLWLPGVCPDPRRN